MCFVCIFLASFSLNAQLSEGKVEYNKIKQPCLIMEYSYPPQAVEDAIENKMSSQGVKGREEKGLFNKDKGFKVYRNALFSEISVNRYDYLVLVERKSRKEDEAAVVHFLIMKGDENFLNKLDTHDLGNAKNFLTNLHPHIEDAHLEIKIADQGEVVSKAEKKMKKLQDEKDDLERKIQKLQDEIKKNEEDQQKQKGELEEHIKTHENLKSKRRKSS